MAEGSTATRRRSPVLTLPNNPEIEASVLGAVLLEAAIPKGLTARLLHNPRHQDLLKLMEGLRSDGRGLDLATVVGAVFEAHATFGAQGASWVASLPGKVPSLEAVPSWIRELQRLAHNRDLAVWSATIQHCIQAGDFDEAARLQKSPPKDPEVLDAAAPAGAPGGQLPPVGAPEAEVRKTLKALRSRKASARVLADEVLRTDTRWRSLLWWNDYQKQKQLGERHYEDADDQRISMWLARVYRIDVAPEAVRKIVDAICADQKRDPLSEYLRGVHWDGTPRIETWLQWGMGVEDTPIHRWMGQAWLVQAVARALRPGCQADATLVLLGEQGEGKTSTLRELVGPFWSESKIDIGNVPRCYQQIAAAWVHELGEMAAFLGSRIDQNEAKNFLTSPVDRFIPLHARHQVAWARRAVFIGTTNRPEILRDPTGARRFWPVEVGKTHGIRRVEIVQLRDQLWAEAVHCLNQGFQWWLPKERWQELRIVQEDFQAGDSWTDAVEAWLNSPEVRNEPDDPLTSKRILVGCIGKKLEHIEKKDEMRLADVMQTMGYQSKTVWIPLLKKSIKAFVKKGGGT